MGYRVTLLTAKNKNVNPLKINQNVIMHILFEDIIQKTTMQIQAELVFLTSIAGEQRLRNLVKALRVDKELEVKRLHMRAS